MGNELVKFDFEKHPVRVSIVDGEPWFVAKDVCIVLGLANVSEATSRLFDDDKGIINVDTLGGKQNLISVSEPGLYVLTLGSRKAEARKFQRWVTREVLPEIRKTGRYAINKTKLPETYLDALKALVGEVEKSTALQLKARENDPKAEAYDIMASAGGGMLIRTFAKHCGVRVDWLYDWFLSEKIILRNTQGNLEPYSRYSNPRIRYFFMRSTPRKGNEEVTDSTTYLTISGCLWATVTLIRKGHTAKESLSEFLKEKICTPEEMGSKFLTQKQLRLKFQK
jgi:prophage antirepressor-like protein